MEILEADDSQVRRLLATGEIEGYTIGKRGVRIYLDSVTDYQARHARKNRHGAAGVPGETVKRRQRQAVSRAAHRDALARLQALGVL